MTGIFRCWRCDKRLPVDEVEGRAVILCPKCKARNPIQTQTLTRVPDTPILTSGKSALL